MPRSPLPPWEPPRSPCPWGWDTNRLHSTHLLRGFGASACLGPHEPLRWELEAGTGQAVPGGAWLPAPTQVQFSLLRSDFSPGHSLERTGRPNWFVHAVHPCKHSAQGKNITVPTPASSISQREKIQCFDWF